MNDPGVAMSKVDFLKLLELTPAGADRWIGYSPDNGWPRVFGGQVVAQALSAAQRTVEARGVHSLHAYFILGGDPHEPIQYDVERVRDGRSFTTRRVVASQRREAIFIMSASFHIEEEGLDHELAAPERPEPEDAPDPRAFLAPADEAALRQFEAFIARVAPIEVRPLDLKRYLPLRPGEARPARQMQWMRIDADLPDDAALHAVGLAYISDLTLLDSALARHGHSIAGGKFQLASLDHTVWFHRPAKVDEWLLYVQDSPTAQGGRGLSRGMLYDRAGHLVANVAQEGLIRPRRAAKTP
jgi:acyl-CoA thioesterase-2